MAHRRAKNLVALQCVLVHAQLQTQLKQQKQRPPLTWTPAPSFQKLRCSLSEHPPPSAPLRWPSGVPHGGTPGSVLTQRLARPARCTAGTEQN